MGGGGRVGLAGSAVDCKLSCRLAALPHQTNDSPFLAHFKSRGLTRDRLTRVILVFVLSRNPPTRHPQQLLTPLPRTGPHFGAGLGSVCLPAWSNELCCRASG